MVTSVWETYFNIFADKYPLLRPSQEDILNSYEDVRDHNVIEIEAPPGTGKSLLAMIIALSEDTDYKNTYRKIVISSRTKQLQHQYVKDFSDILKKHGISYAVGKGLSSFPCKYKHNSEVCLTQLGLKCKYMPKILDGTYEELVDLIEDPNYDILYGFNLSFALDNPKAHVKLLKIYEDTCDYWRNEFQVYNSKVIFTNHHYLLVHLLFNDSLPCPSVIVFDEAHTLPSTFSDLCTIKIYGKLYKYLQENKLLDNCRDFVTHKEDYEGLSNFIEYMYDSLEVMKEDVRNITGPFRMELSSFIYKIIATYTIKSFIETEGEHLKKYFVISVSDKGITITPTYFSSIAFIDYLSTLVNKIILMSATLPPQKYSFSDVRITSLKDMFPPSRRRVIYLEDIKVTNTNIFTKSITNYIYIIVSSIYQYPGFRKIVIHTYNNMIKDLLTDYLINNNYKVFVTDKDIQKTIADFVKSKEGILIGAGLSEGVDFKYDTARAQIIVKAPIPDVRTDPFMRFLSKYYPELYHWYFALYIVQASGRITRAHDDFGFTIILDNRALNHFRKHSTLYPIYYRQAVSVRSIRQLPMLLDTLYNAYLTTLEEKGEPLPDMEEIIKTMFPPGEE